MYLLIKLNLLYHKSHKDSYITEPFTMTKNNDLFTPLLSARLDLMSLVFSKIY